MNYQNVMCIQKIYFLQDIARFLQVRKILEDFCKNAIASKNLARIEIFVRILQEFMNLQETCKILHEINFLSTRAAKVTVRALTEYYPYYNQVLVANLFANTSIMLAFWWNA